MLRWAGIESGGGLAWLVCLARRRRWLTCAVRCSFCPIRFQNWLICAGNAPRFSSVRNSKFTQTEWPLKTVESEEGNHGATCDFFSHVSRCILLDNLASWPRAQQVTLFFFSLIAKANNDDPSFRTSVFFFIFQFNYSARPENSHLFAAWKEAKLKLLFLFEWRCKQCLFRIGF